MTMKLRQSGYKPLILIQDPTEAMGAVTKRYVDTNISNHATDMSLHLTAEQNVLLDNITATHTEINYLSGVTSNVQNQLNDKFDKAGGTISGNVTVSSGNSIFVSTAPTQASELVNKAYVDARVSGQDWKDPVTDINLVSTTLVSPPANPVVNDVYIVASGATGLWAGKDGKAVYHNGTSWVELQGRAVQAGDRFGVALTTSTLTTAELTSLRGQLVTVESVLNDVYVFVTDTRTAASSVLVFDENSKWFGVVYTYSDEGSWIPTNTSVNISPGTGLSLSGNILNINYGQGLTASGSNVTVSLLSSSGLYFTEDGVTASAAQTAKLSVKLKDSSLSSDASGLYISTAVMESIADKVSKSSPSTVNTTLTFPIGSSIVIDYTATDANQAINKGYVDGVTTTINDSLTLIQTDLTALKNDPTNKQYVDTELAKKVAKAGDTMTGLLTLSGAPTSDLHAATKKYVDDAKTSLETSITDSTSGKVNRSGDTMTGALHLFADPTVATEAANKRYVDLKHDALSTTITDGLNRVDGDISSINTIIAGLKEDPTTKAYVDTELAKKVAKAGDSMTGFLTLHADPTQNLHAATKQYVDNIATGLFTKPSVRYATTANLNASYVNGNSGINSVLTGLGNGTLVVDGGTPQAGDRILVRKQNNKIQNGAYVVQQVGDETTPFILIRVETINESSEVPGSYFFVTDGDTLKGTGWTTIVQNPTTFRIGVDIIDVNQFSGQGSVVAGDGLVMIDNIINIQTASSNRIVVNADNIDLATTGVSEGWATRVKTDVYGRIIETDNPTTLAGYGITDAQSKNANLDSLSAIIGSGFVTKSNTNTYVTKEIKTSGAGLSIQNGTGAENGDIVISSNATSANTASTVVSRDASGNIAVTQVTGNLDGNASTATKLANSRTIGIGGNDLTATSVAFDGTANVTLNVSIKDTGVTAGTYTKVDVNAKGQVTGGTSPTTIAELGVADVYTKAEVDTLVADLTSRIENMMIYIVSNI